MLGYLARYDGLLPADGPPPTRAACNHLAFVALVLSLPATLAFLARTAPAVASLHWPDVMHETLRAFPPGLELVFNESRLLLRPSPSAYEPAAGAAAAADDDGTFVCWSNEAEGTAWCAREGGEGEGLSPIRVGLSQRVADAFYIELPGLLPFSPAKLASFFVGTDGLDPDADGFPDIR